METVKVLLLMFVIGKTGLGLHHAQLQVTHHLIENLRIKMTEKTTNDLVIHVFIV